MGSRPLVDARSSSLLMASSKQSHVQALHLIVNLSKPWTPSHHLLMDPLRSASTCEPFVTRALGVRDNRSSRQTSAAQCPRAEDDAGDNFSMPRGNSIPGLGLVQRAEIEHVRPGDTNEEEKEAQRRELQALAALRQGRILGDSQVFRQTCVIRSYEVSAEGTTSIDTILSLFQDVALNHVSLLGISGHGFGATRGMNQNRLIWVITRLHVEVDRYPTWPEAVEIDSWVGVAGKNGMRRDWLLREHATGKIIARATSTWAMMHQDTRRLSRIPDVVKDEIVPVFVEKYAMENAAQERIARLDNSADYITSNLTSCRQDLDVNQHVNNVKYIQWVMQSIPSLTMETHELCSITLEYRKECNKDDIVESLTNLEEDFAKKVEECQPSLKESPPLGYVNGDFKFTSISGEKDCVKFPNLRYTHLLQMQKNGEEIVRGRSVWKTKSLVGRASLHPDSYSTAHNSYHSNI